MAKYGGGHEDFEKERKELEGMTKATTEQAAREATFQKKLTETNRLTTEGARASRTRAIAKKEAAEADERAARSAGKSAEAVKVDTAAIEANTRARERANRVKAFGPGAVKGAQSPQYAEAYRLMQEQGQVPSQYRLRQIGGVGQRRAADMVQAMQAGLQPAAGNVDVNRPLQRVAAAHEGVAASEYRLTQANEEYTRVRKKGTEAEAQAAYQAREAAKGGRESAHMELAAAQKDETARLEHNQAAIQRETEARGRIADQKVREQRLLSQIDRAEQARVDMMQAEARDRARAGIAPRQQLALPAAGQTVQGMPLHLAQVRTAVPAPPPQQSSQPPQPPNWVKGDPARVKAMEESARSIELEGRHAAAMGRTAAANREAAASFYPLSQAMHRHGALTSEFITAAARGEVTLREMGNQAVITAGKFGGWTVAASGVYAVAGALGQVAEGAIKASSGTDQAYRVITTNKNPDALQKSFGDLSSQFNVPIETAADAVYRMGQVFHDQDQAVKAAEASLYSFKTGEVDVATSTKNLIAIQRAFGLSSTGLVDIFDQINQAQNTFGIGIGDTEGGLAKAAGTWKQAGGDLSTLLALFVAIQKATGRGGEEIGTSLSRLYYVQHPEAAAKLKGLGVDVNLRDAQKTFKSAMEQAKKPGADIQGLASGLLGNQYARMMTAVLADQTTFNDALRDTSPEKSKGSAQKELAKVLNQVDEQIQMLGNHFQRLGEVMARAGAFNFAGLLLKALNGTLGAAEALVNVFNHLPSPLREGVTMLAEMAVGLALLRRLGATERLANTPLGFLADPVGRQKTHTIAGLRQGQTESFNRLERYGSINVDKAFQADMKRSLVEQMRPEFQSVQHLDVRDPQRKAVEKRWDKVNLDAERAEGALAVSTRELDASRQVAIRSQDDLTLAQNTSRRKFAGVAAQKGWPSVRELDQPNTAGIAIAGVPGGGQGGRAASAMDGAAVSARRAARSTDLIRNRAAALAASIELMSGPSTKLGTTGRGLSRAAQATGNGLARGAGFVERAAVSMRTLPGSMAAMASALGPLDLALLAVGVGLAVDSVVGSFEKELQSLGKFSSKSGNVNTTAKVDAVKAKADQIKKVGQTDAQYRSDALSQINDFFNPVELIGSTIPEAIKGTYETAADKRARINAEILQADQNRVQREAMQARQGAKGKPLPQLTWDQLKASIKQDAELRKNGLITQAEFDQAMANHAIEAKVMLNSTKEQREAARRELAAANRAAQGAGYDAALVAMPVGEFQKEQQGTGAAIELYGITDHNMDYAKRQYAAAETRWRNSNDPDALIALNAARNAYFQAIIGETQKELQFELLGARNESERRAIFTRASQQYEQARITVKQQGAERRDFKKKAEDAKKEQDRVQKIEDQGGLRHQAGVGDGLRPGEGNSGNYRPDDAEVRARENAQLKSREARAKSQRKTQKQIDADLDRQNRDLDLAALQLKQQAYEDRSQGREILLNLQLAGTADPMRQAALRIDVARRQVADAAREWGSQSRQYRQALTELRNAQTQQAQAILSGVQADNAILLAKAGDDPVRQAAVAAENARRELQTMQADPKKFDPNQVKQQRANVINADRAARDARQQQTADLIRLQGELDAARAGGDPVATAKAAIKAAQLAKKNASTDVEKLQALVDLANANNALQDALVETEQAKFDLLKSQTDDPVEKAKIDLDAAKNAMKGAKGLNKIKKQTDYNNAKKAYEDAKISDREDNINFEFQMDKITADEAAKQLEALANIKGISKAKKRELLLQAKQLRDQASGDYELDVGSIRLPSLYEVRRFVQGGQPNASQVVTDNRNFVVNIANADAAYAFGSTLEMTNGTSAKAAARSMQMR